MSPEDLDAIEEANRRGGAACLGEVRALVAEVRRLRAECSGLHKARETESVRMRDLEMACDEMRAQRDESQGALRWILSNVEHASGKFQGCASGQLLVDLARAVAKNATQMEASS